MTYLIYHGIGYIDISCEIWIQCEVWIPQLLTEISLMNIFTCYLLLQRYERDSFLKRLVIRDEIWIKMCIENAFCPRTIDLQLSRSLDFIRKKFFCSFGGIGKVYSTTSFFLKIKPSIVPNIIISLIN